MNNYKYRTISLYYIFSICSLLNVEQTERKEYLKAFGKNFRKLRKSKGYSQAKLAIDLESDVSLISRIERGLLNTTVIKLKEVSQILDIKIEDFFKF